nr:uncharacterized protein LOC129270468 [Lytechinus pictus]
MDWSITRGRRKQPSSVITCEDCQPSEDDGPIPGLLVKDTLTVVTPSGECKIELCLGDITKLPQQDKVDVILISAYGGCYSKGVGVMGALYRQMGIDVYQLAKSHKEEDLQDLYSCWWTKPLPENLPFKRLLCFETRGSTTFSGTTGYDLNRGAKGRPSELVSHAFRCLVPILNNQDGTVITPLLNSGSQGCDECEMLQGMVENAVNWMKAGLPLRLLKIVIYSKVMSRTTASMILQRADGSEILDLFSQLKERLETKSPIPKMILDVNAEVQPLYERLEQSRLAVRRAWLTNLLAKCKGKEPSYTFKKMLDGFFQPSQLGKENSSSMMSNYPDIMEGLTCKF